MSIIINDILGALLIIFAIYVHELGHYIDAKRHGIYKGWFLNGLMAGVKMTQPFPKVHLYLGGVVYSFLTYPIALLFMAYGIYESNIVWVFPVLLLSLGIGDYFIMTGHKDAWRIRNVKRKVIAEKDVWYNRLMYKSFDLDNDDAIVVWLKR